MTQAKQFDDLHIETLAVRAAVERSQYGENSEALFLTSGYVQPTAAAAAARRSMRNLTRPRKWSKRQWVLWQRLPSHGRS